MKIAKMLSLFFPSFCISCQKKYSYDEGVFLLCGDCRDNIIFSFTGDDSDEDNSLNHYYCFHPSYPLDKVCSSTINGKYPYFMRILASFMLLKLSYLPYPLSYKIIPYLGGVEDKKERKFVKNVSLELKSLLKKVACKSSCSKNLFVAYKYEKMNVIDDMVLSISYNKTDYC